MGVFISRLTATAESHLRGRRLTLCFAILAVVLYCAAQPATNYVDVLETKKLVLREKNGAPRAAFEIARSGQPKLTFLWQGPKEGISFDIGGRRSRANSFPA